MEKVKIFLSKAYDRIPSSKKQMKNALFMLFSLALSVPLLQAQEVKYPKMTPPLNVDLALSGNFGELRSGHFHGGVDFKTWNETGKPVVAPADGYISRVSVSNGGYGNGLYITHTNGYTTVYGHLDAFLPQVAERIREYQYAHKTYVTDLTFGPEEFPVREGELVALSGNTGYSFGPHLHFEVRQTSTDEPIDPLLFYKDVLTDDVPPRASSVMLYPKKGKGLVNGSTEKVMADVKDNTVQQTELTAWGKIGAAIAAYDYMTGTTNYYGVQSVKLFVDDVLVSESKVGRFDFSENRMLDSWIDYEERLKTGKWYMRSTIATHNPLRMLKAYNGDYGWVTIDEPRTYHFRYELRDIYGNLSVYRFNVKGVPQEISSDLTNYFFFMKAGEAHSLTWKDLSLWIPKNGLYEDLQLDLEVKDGTYQFCAVPTPLLENAELRIQVPQPLTCDKSKYCIAEVWNGSQTYRGGTYEYGWVKTTVSRLGTYIVTVDTVPPRIEPHKQNTWGADGCVSFKLGDAGSGVRDYKGTIDGEWKLFRFNSKDMLLWCDLNEEQVARGHHRAEITITDLRDNVAVKTFDFDY